MSKGCSTNESQPNLQIDESVGRRANRVSPLVVYLARIATYLFLFSGLIPAFFLVDIMGVSRQGQANTGFQLKKTVGKQASLRTPGQVPITQSLSDVVITPNPLFPLPSTGTPEPRSPVTDDHEKYTDSLHCTCVRVAGIFHKRSTPLAGKREMLRVYAHTQSSYAGDQHGATSEWDYLNPLSRWNEWVQSSETVHTGKKSPATGPQRQNLSANGFQ
ncbi:hypothetical protein COLO4_02554 [Corchorus olitorius]|uniref:Uncharacterized protein n=1 Tax=Corchorus olitorius TaxID=93759 RepID=A0A1R3L0R2_9ROSI|nr:hypothetical protein COLO4_02554 [Corchorus olitorius]